MGKKLSWQEAGDILMEQAVPVGTERKKLQDACGRILAAPVAALENVPPFDRSPYDGYALRSADTAGALPVTLRILEEIPAGSVPTQALTPGTAVKILTGAPVPEGADCCVKFEETTFTAETVTVSRQLAPGENLVREGEDVRAGQLLAEPGSRVDSGIAGAVASQGIAELEVYQVPRIGVLSIGSELIAPGEPQRPGSIYNSSRYALQAVLEAEGMAVSFYPIPRDDTDAIAALVDQALQENDAVITTGGVSVGDYDLTKSAYEQAGVQILCGDLSLKPGGKSWYGIRDGRLIFGLSGNPASAMTNFYAIVLPALRKLRGDKDGRLPELSAVLAEDFKKGGKQTRLLRGRLSVQDGRLAFFPADKQGNSAIHTLAGANALAEIPAGAGPQKAGAQIKVYYIGSEL